jgi:hypothetical protein
MKQLALLIATTAFSSVLWAQGAGPAGLPKDQAGRCRYAAEGMIKFGREALSDPRVRREPNEKRRKLLDEWSARLAKGEDPCRVYLDIQRAATTF